MAHVLFDGNWPVMEAIRDGNQQRVAATVAWMLRAAKGYAMMPANPGGTEARGFGNDRKIIHEQVSCFSVTPAEITLSMIRANEALNLPHSGYIYYTNPGTPGHCATMPGTFDWYYPVRMSNYPAQNNYTTHGICITTEATP
jgi:formylmethanofuran dehydrogenase subunit A